MFVDFIDVATTVIDVVVLKGPAVISVDMCDPMKVGESIDEERRRLWDDVDIDD